MTTNDSFGALMPMLSYKTAVEPIREVLAWIDERFGVRSFAIGAGLGAIWRGEECHEVTIYVPLHPKRSDEVMAALETLEAYRECPFALFVVCRVRRPEYMLGAVVKAAEQRIAMTAREDLITETFLKAMEDTNAI